jgi:hypothetical protein
MSSSLCSDVLGERLLDNAICAAVIKGIIRLVELADKDGLLYCPKKEAANIIYRGMTADSPARLLMVGIHQTSGTTDWLDSTCEPDLSLDVAKRFYKVFEGHLNSNFIRVSALKVTDYLSYDEG